MSCQLTGFIVYFVGCIQIYLMTALSYERYLILKNNKNLRSMRFRSVAKSIYFSILFGLFWSGKPLVGWSYYSSDGNKISCSVEWKQKNLNVVSYNIGVFIFVFIVPFTLIIVTNLKSIIIVKLLFLQLSLFEF